jgi:hypothetical protein
MILDYTMMRPDANGRSRSVGLLPAPFKTATVRAESDVGLRPEVGTGSLW